MRNPAISKRIHSAAALVLTLLASTALQTWALDPGLPPSGNFDLTTWKVTLPDQSEEDVASLLAGFESANEFYTDPATGAMVFRCPNDGATGGSSYPRSELREMLRGTDTSISTKGINSNNWVFSTATQTHQEDAGGVDGILTATLAVDHVSTTGTDWKIGRVIVGQIHASGDEPCRLYYRKLPGNTKGCIYMAHEPTKATGLPEQWYDMIGDRSDSASDPVDGIALGEQFSYEIKVVGADLNVTIMRPGKPDVTQHVDMTSTGHLDDWMYFKAGCYNQNETGDAGEYAQVSFYALTKTHNMFGNESPTCSITSPAQGATFDEGDDVVINADASDSDGTITKVEFYEGANLLGEDTTAPYSYTWANVRDGSHSLTARATDDGGAETTSTAVSITVLPGPNDPPTCSITSPAQGATYTEGGTVVIDADASDTDGIIAKVEFYEGANKLGEDTTAPYSFSWNNVPQGSYNLTAKATDDNAAETTSAAVGITVNPSVILTSEDFESGFGDWVNVTGDTDDWSRDSGGTSSGNTGPSSGANGSTYYVYLETSSSGANDAGDYAILECPDLAAGTGRTLSFYYHMYGNTMGTLNVDVYSDGSWTEGVWSRSGEQHSSSSEAYTQATVDLSAYTGTIRIRFRGVAVGNVRGDMAIDDIEVRRSVIPNQPPTCSITSPTNGATYTEGDDIVINADASDNDGTITKVEFYEGASLLGEDTTAPYSYTWTHGGLGSYSLTAKATDDDAAETTSTAVGISVDEAPMLAIALDGSNVVLSWPTAGSTGFDLESTVDLADAAWSTNGTIPPAIGDFNYVTNPAAASEEFYRLYRP